MWLDHPYIRGAVLALFIYRLKYVKIEANKRRPLEARFSISDNILSDVNYIHMTLQLEKSNTVQEVIIYGYTVQIYRNR